MKTAVHFKNGLKFYHTSEEDPRSSDDFFMEEIFRTLQEICIEVDECRVFKNNGTRVFEFVVRFKGLDFYFFGRPDSSVWVTCSEDNKLNLAWPLPEADLKGISCSWPKEHNFKVWPHTLDFIRLEEMLRRAFR